MGEVYKARDTRLGRDVAIKVLPAALAADPERRRRFEQEARAVSALNHPHICVLHDIGREGDTDFLVMEYLDGQTLGQRLRKGALPLAQALDLGAQIADALAAAHHHGIVHRDLKPANVMLTKAGAVRQGSPQAKLLDFGLAKLRPQPAKAGAGLSELSTQAPATTSGAVMGTVPYMAPEQLEGKPTDARTDLFAFGCVLYEMLTARRAFGGDSEASVISGIMSGEPPPLSALQPLMPHALDRLVHRCLAKDPDERWESAHDIAEELRGIAADSGAPAPAMSAPPRRPRRRRAWAAATAAAVVVAALVGGWMWKTLPARTTENADAARILPSVAVLPFADLSPEKDQEYLSNGLAEDLINSLSELPGLHVTARESAFSFKGKHEDLRVIGKALGVANILEGSVQKAGDRVRITVRLVGVAALRTLWSSPPYDHELKDVFAIEDDIAAKVTSALRPKLLGEAAVLPRASQATNAEAYQAFLQARYFNRTGDPKLASRAFDSIDRAIQFDPSYAPAYALRSVMTAEAGLMDTGDRELLTALQKSRQDARKAIALDPKLAAGWRALSEAPVDDWNWQAADQAAKKARELSPGDADVLHQCSYLAWVLGRLEEAESLSRQAIDIDPLMPGNYHFLGHIFLGMGRYDDAHAAFQTSLQLAPNQVFTRELNGEVYLAQHRFPEALAEMRKEPGESFRDLGEALAYHALGRRRESEAASAHLIAQYQDVAAYQIAEVYAYRGELDQAFHWLERARQQHDGGLGWLKSEWLLKNLRRDPRYSRLLREVNLAE